MSSLWLNGVLNRQTGAGSFEKPARCCGVSSLVLPSRRHGWVAFCTYCPPTFAPHAKNILPAEADEDNQARDVTRMESERPLSGPRQPANPARPGASRH